MIRTTVIYGTPTDPISFEAHYVNVHVPLVVKMPKLKNYTFSKTRPSTSEGAPATFLIAFLDYETEADLNESLSSDEGKAAVADVSNFATGGVTLITALL